MEIEKYKRLYSGFCAEYHLISNIYRLGLEANKLVIDFGFDVIVTNQFKRMLSGYSDEPCTKLIQVKSRWFPEWQRDDIGNSSLDNIIFGIKKEDIINLINERNSFLACYVCLSHKEEFYIPCGILLNNINIKELLLENYITFDNSDNQYKLRLSIEAQTGSDKFHSFIENSVEPSIQQVIDDKNLVKSINDNIIQQWDLENSPFINYPYRYKSSLHPSLINVQLNHPTKSNKRLDLPTEMYDINYMMNPLPNTTILTAQLSSDEIDMSSTVHSSSMYHQIETVNWNEVLESKISDD